MKKYKETDTKNNSETQISGSEGHRDIHRETDRRQTDGQTDAPAH